MDQFFHQAKLFTYTHQYLMYESGLRKTDMYVVRRTAFYCCTCKNYAKLWLMPAKVFERKSKTYNEHTVAILCQRHDFILLHHIFDFLAF